MGISAIFKRSKASGVSDSGSESQKTRLIKRRQDASTPADSKAGVSGRGMAAAEYAVRTRKATGRYAPAPASLSSSDMDSLPTPDDSVDEGMYGRHQPSKSKAKAKPTAMASQRPPPVNTQRLGQGMLNDDVLGLHSLRTPPLDAPQPQPKALDPFEDSPPRRPLSDFEDPVYIPPLTLAATLFDDYGAAGALPAAAAPASATSARAADDRATMAPAGGSKPVDLLSEFNATYSYLFGSLPSEPAAGEPARAASRTNDGLLSPASTEPSKTPSPVHEEASDSDDKSTVSGCSSAEADAPELVEERRREEERKAAELRSRRREMIKQQVAFERMKERHRRQCPGQPTGPPAGSIARWQRDPGGAAMLGQTVQQSASQNPLFASSATINRGFAQGAPPQHAQRMNGSFYSNMAANASMPNIAQSPEALQMQMQMQRPLLVDTAAARAAAGAGYPYSAPTFQPPHQHHVHPGFQSPPQLTAHPVKLASMPQPAKNPYLSDSSGDNASDSSSADSSVDTSSTGSSDASYSSFKLSSDPGSAGFEVKDTAPRMVRSVSQPTPRRDIGAQNASNDSSSEESAKSQSSSKRRVRFHETVSVVFNTRHSAAGDDGHCSSDSDNDSSNASVDLAERSPSSAAGSGFAHSPSRRGSGVAGYADDAFDDASALGHLRYQIPAMAPMQWTDIDAAALTNSKQSSGTSSRNISPDGAKGRKQRPKHRIETQPLRDREAEREQRRMETAGADRRIEAAPGSSKNSRALAQDSHAGGGETAGSATSDAAEEPQRLDPMTEARRALLGHYNAPSPLITLNNGIPRSTNASSVPRTSSVKVIGPQSFARPKARFSAKPASNNTASNTAGPAKSSWESYKGRQRTQPSSDRQANGGQDAKQPPASTVNPSAADARKTHRESDEFDFSNVLQNFSVTSFEVTKSNEGGVYIRYSDRDKSDECMDDAGDSSGEDDIPLSAIARSRSEPNANTYRRAAAAARMSRNPSLLGGSRNPSLSGGPGNKTDGKTDTKTDGDGKQDARKRVLVRNSTSNSRTSSDKRRLSRWGNIF